MIVVSFSFPTPPTVAIFSVLAPCYIKNCVSRAVGENVLFLMMSTQFSNSRHRSWKNSNWNRSFRPNTIPRGTLNRMTTTNVAGGNLTKDGAKGVLIHGSILEVSIWENIYVGYNCYLSAQNCFYASNSIRFFPMPECFVYCIQKKRCVLLLWQKIRVTFLA